MPTNIKAHCGAINLDDGSPIEETFIDNGDGTYARLMGAAGTVSIGEVTVSDGGDAALGATTDTTAANTLIGRIKNLLSRLPAALTAGGNLKAAILEALPAGTNVVGKVGIDQSTPGTTNAVVITGADPDSYTRSDTYTGAANGVTVDMTANPGLVYGLQIKGTGAAPSAWNIVLETSLDGVNWSTDITHSNGSFSDGQILSATAHPRLYMRSRCVSLTLGSATNVVATILALR